MATELEKAVKDKKDLNVAIQELVLKVYKENKRVLFNGNGYSEEWHKEAEGRGLANLKNTVEVLPVVIRKDTVELFEKYGVYTEAELKSRFNILSEAYVKALTIEGKTALLMAKTMILPAALRYAAELAGSVSASKTAGVASPAGMDTLNTLNTGIGDLQKAIASSTTPSATPPRASPTTTPSTPAARSSPPSATSARPATCSKPWSPTTSGRCRPTAKCCSSSKGPRPISIPHPGPESPALSGPVLLPKSNSLGPTFTPTGPLHV